VKEHYPLIGNVHGLGLCIGVELVTDREQKTSATEAADRILHRCLENGLSFKTTMGNVLTLTPLLIVTEEQMEEALEILEEAIAAETL
jgi:4-aminobutyrate aminotransferase